MDISYAVGSFPTLSNKDFDWIQRFRAKHDMWYELIDPHFTLVFPGRLEKTSYINHIRRLAMGVPKFDFTIRCALTVPGNTPGDISHVFLIPDKGFSDIVKLHDRLYTDMLSSKLALEIPFYPHIGIANSIEIYACKKLADEINELNFTIEGVVDTIDIVEIVASERVSTEVENAVSTIRSIKSIDRIELA